MSPRIIAVLLFVLASGVALASAYFYGISVGKAVVEAAEAREERLVRAAIDAAATTSAAAIRDIKVVNRTIQQKVEREIQTNTVFRDCKLPDGVRDTINQAIAARPNAAASGVLPTADPVGR